MDADLKGKLVLVVDPEPDMRELIRFALSARGASIVEAESGGKALEILTHQRVHLVIADVRIPELSGVELMRALQKRSGPRPAFILIAGFPDISEAEAYILGAAAIFPKPFSLDALSEAAGRALVGVMRRHARVETRFPIVLFGSDGESSGMVRNLSLTGMYVVLAAIKPRETTALRFQFEIGGNHAPVEGEAAIRWLKGESEGSIGCGLEFTRLSEDGRQCIDELVRRLARPE